MLSEVSADIVFTHYFEKMLSAFLPLPCTRWGNSVLQTLLLPTPGKKSCGRPSHAP